MNKEKQKVDYGVDAPGVIRHLFLAGIALLLLSRFVPPVTVGGATFILRPMFRNTGIGCIAGGVLTAVYSKFMKFRRRLGVPQNCCLRLRSALDFSPVYGPTSLLPHFPLAGLPVTRSWR